MKTIALTIFLLFVSVLPMTAQFINVEEFKRVKKSLIPGQEVRKDKQHPVMDLITNEKGFTVKANGDAEVEVEEGDGMITLLLPHPTTFLTIKHPDYGQTTWMVPKGKLKRKRHYRAYLHTSSPKKRYELNKQWVIFDISPENAIVQIDSTLLKTRDGKVQVMLPVGSHTYQVLSPFHKPVIDTVVVEDTVASRITAHLQPFYSYLTVKPPEGDYDVYIDDQLLGNGEVTSGHLTPGYHQLTIRRHKMYFYDTMVKLGPAEKRTIEVPADSLKTKMMYEWNPRRFDSTVLTEDVEESSPKAQPSDKIQADVTLIAANDSTEIWLNRSLVGTGKWKGKLSRGFYLVTTKEGQLESKPFYFWVDDSFPVNIDLSSPHDNYGLLNIYSNVVGASIFIDDVYVGQTPCIVPNLPASRNHLIELKMEGYKDAKQVIKPRGNDLIDVSIKMKVSK